MSTQVATKRHAKNTHLSEMRYIGNVLRIEIVDPKMHIDSEKGCRRRMRR
jgi:hypothetical protein